MSTITIGLDLGDRFSRYCELDAAGVVLAEGRVATTPAGLRQHFAGRARCRIVCEVGTHSPWVSRLLASCGHEVLVANARQVRLIYAGDRKSDRIDAETLARLGRLDPRLLRPIQHRGAEAQAALAQLRARDALVRVRTVLINHVRGAVKSTGQRLPASSAPAFARTVAPHLEAAMQPALAPLLTMIATLSDQIRELERQLDALALTRYPETARLRQVGGVGLLIALAFVLTVEDPNRFAKSREVGPYLGLCPRQASSGRYQPELRISKRGDALLRRLLVNGAQYILGPFGPECTLRRKGLALAARGGKHAKKRAVIATARRLAVLLHRLWVGGAVYEPERQAA
jgi:transposase